jgi:nitrogen fixation NifU-like protein
MTDADAHARVTGQCGDSMEIYLKFENGRVKEASYFTDGCASSAICSKTRSPCRGTAAGVVGDTSVCGIALA